MIALTIIGRSEVGRVEQNIKISQSALNRARSMEAMRAERKKDVTITFNETGEAFTIKKRVAIPLLEALRLYKKMEETPENTSSDLSMTARMLQIFSEIHY